MFSAVLSNQWESIRKRLFANKKVEEVPIKVPSSPKKPTDTFYAQDGDYDVDLRFGDVIEVDGLISATPKFKALNRDSEIDNFAIDVVKPQYCVVMTPCCSIGEKTLILTPLQQLRKSFFKNPYYYEDFRRINRKMGAQQSISPDDWSKLLPEDQQDRMKEETEYALLELFIYAPHQLLPEYDIKKAQLPSKPEKVDIKTGYYMIDFRNNFRICSDDIVYNEKKGSNSLGHIKILELSIATRSELRDKLSEYYYKPALEDLVESD